jgi:uncharacterized membrane protein YjgN (DUF898 family)
MSDIANPSQAPLGETIRFEYVPKPGLWRIAIVNFLLGIVTLTIYRFWGKTRARQHIWSCVHVNGQPLEYTGTGKELFVGFLKVFFLFSIPLSGLLVGLQLALGVEHPSVAIVQIAVILLIYLLWGAALYLSRRYQLSRTTWRGIRGTLSGSPLVYSLLYFGGMMGRSMSLGWATPVINLALQEKMIGEMRFGDLAFKLRGRAGPLYPVYALCWFLTLAAIGIAVAAIVGSIVWLADTGIGEFFKELFDPNSPPSETTFMIIGVVTFALLVVGYLLIIPLLWSIYSAREMNLFASYTKAGNATFSFNATAWSLVGLVMGNILLFVFTLGMARPIIAQRIVRFFCDRILVHGTINVDAISQSMHKYDKSGEGLADAFDLSAI